MIHKAKDLSPDQKVVLESLLGRSIGPEEAISVRAIPSVAAPEWLQESWESSKREGLDQLSMEEIEEEIVAVRRARRENHRPSEQ